MEIHYTNEKNLQIIIALLKAHGLRKVITSPGTTNHTLVASMQNDSWFEMFSSVDERSAAYMACGLSAECGEPVVITCTEATASRNYLPGLTEAFYRKLPILAIATTHGRRLAGQHIAQVLDHSVLPNDVAKKNIYIPVCQSDQDAKYIELKVNEAILELSHHGGGPVYLNVETLATRDYSCKQLPNVRKIQRYVYCDNLPMLPKGKIGVFIGSHKHFCEDEENALNTFCAVNNAVAFCDHTSSYKGKYRIDYSIVGGQEDFNEKWMNLDLIVHIGEVTGDYFSIGCCNTAKAVWRVSEDGELRDSFNKLTAVFEMKEFTFFTHYSTGKSLVADHVIKTYKEMCEEMRNRILDLPFSNIWIASQVAPRLPENSEIHFSILSSLRSWNLFELPKTVQSSSNVGGFGIDGCVSTFIGASLANSNKLYFGVFGDLAFFYDLNSIGNRHIGCNVRIMLINNGKGAEFRLYWHPASQLGDYADAHISAGGHFGNKSHSLVKGIAESLGFEYLTASNKKEFLTVYDKFINSKISDHPLFFEVFTTDKDESDALYKCRHLVKSPFSINDVKKIVKSMVGEKLANKIKNIIK